MKEINLLIASFPLSCFLVTMWTGETRPWRIFWTQRFWTLWPQRPKKSWRYRCAAEGDGGGDTSAFEMCDAEVGVFSLWAQKVKLVSPGKSVWLGETSSAYGGGAAGLSDTFAAGFMWVYTSHDHRVESESKRESRPSQETKKIQTVSVRAETVNRFIK